MTLNEFKAWFEGFTEDMDGAPSEKQFEKIKTKVAEIDDKPIEKQVFIDRYHHYWPRHYPIWNQPYVSYSGGAVNTGDAAGKAVLSAADVKAAIGDREVWDAGAAMYALGKAEFSGEIHG